MAGATIIPLACADPGEPGSEAEGPVAKARSRAVLHDLSWKINTTNSGAAYINECQAAGVPVPEVIADPNDPRWINHGEVVGEFLSPGLEAEIWSYEDPNVDGVCAALPRWDGVYSELFGVICLGRTTSTICFWDNPRDEPFLRGVGTPITQFVGGFDLEANKQGTCSDCHAGENPFVVHPADPAFADFRAARVLTPNDWPKPIVHSSWPGNPGPLDALGPVPPGEVQCDGCHGVGSGIRFPLVSSSLPQYCGTILGSATSGTTQTMPLGGGNGTTHVNWLLAQCGAEPATGTTVSVEGFASELLSPPIVGPVYACSSQVLVSGLVYGADLAFEVDGEPVEVPTTAPGPEMVVDVGEPLVVEQTISVSQLKDGLKSDVDTTVVQDHEQVYPGGLPAPIINPAPLYTCARSLGVSNVPGGVELIVDKTNGGVPVDTYTQQSALSSSWVLLWNEPAFVMGDAFTVKQKICEDTSPPAAEVAVVPAPTTLAAPEFIPDLVEGQQVANVGSFVQGAHLTVSSSGSPIVDWLSSPYTFFEVDLAGPLGSPVTTSHNITLEQELCGAFGRDNVTISGCDPGELLAKIALPVAGDTFVVVTDAVPGATIHVTANDGQIGSGSGSVIALTRELVGGETIVVIEELPECLATVGYEIQVLNL